MAGASNTILSTRPKSKHTLRKISTENFDPLPVLVVGFVGVELNKRHRASQARTAPTQQRPGGKML